MKPTHLTRDISIAASKYRDEKKYWLSRMHGELDTYTIPYDFIPKNQPRKEFSRRQCPVIDGQSAAILKKLSNGIDYTLHIILLAVLNILLDKYNYICSGDIVSAVPIYRQKGGGAESRPQDLVNTLLPIRVNPTEAQTFKQLLLQVRTAVVEAEKNKNYPFEALLENLGMSLSNDNCPLFDVSLILDSIHDITYLDAVPLNLVFRFDKKENHLEWSILYNGDLYREETIRQAAAYFLNLLQQVLADIDLPIAPLPLVSEEESTRLAALFNPQPREFPRTAAIHPLFSRQAEQTPDAPCVIGCPSMESGENNQRETLNYREVEEKSDLLARYLVENGLKPGSIAAITLEPSVEVVVGILAVLKTGAAYLPIAPTTPPQRISYILKDACATMLLTDHSTAHLASDGQKTVNISEHACYQPGNPTLSLPTVSGDALAYVIYTSGSTGKPKGVAVAHSALVNLCCWHNRHFAVTPEDRAAKYAGFGFDVSVWEMFPYLIVGASLYMVPENIKLDIDKLNAFFEDNRVTIAFLSTQVFEKFIKVENASLRFLVTAGDKLKEYAPTRYRQVNNYGPTETTVVNTTFEVDRQWDNIPIGKPLDNNFIYILDKNNRPCPPGVPGELCLAGDCLAQGYLNRPQLTADKFIPNPYGEGRLYRSGDLARYMADGNILFMGRLDQQVKIRGFRIELGEIENRILKIDGVREAVVVARNDVDGDKYLCAYIVCSGEISVRHIREALSAELPEYMIPPFFVALDKLPLNSSGKIDRKALPKPDSNERTVARAAPGTETEKTLTAIWCDLLNREKEHIGIDDNFFRSGGHSLKATEMVSRIHKQLGVRLELGDVFKNNTIRAIAGLLDKNKDNTPRFSSLPPLEKREYYPASASQRRMHVLQQMAPGSTAYNLPFALRLQGPLQREKLERVFHALVERHESFRTSFHVLEGEIVQKIHDKQYTPFEVVYRDAAGSVPEHHSGPFDLSRAPLLRVELVNIAEAEHLLKVDMHHIISDGQSMGILVKDFMSLYGGEQLLPPSIQYKEFAHWQNRRFRGGQWERMKEWWSRCFETVPPVPALPYDYPRPRVKSHEGAAVSFTIEPQRLDALNQLAASEGLTLFMVMSALLGILLGKAGGVEDVVLGTPVAGREHADLRDIVGMFVNTLALRYSPQSNQTLSAYLKQCGRVAVDAFTHQEFPFEEVVEIAGVGVDASRNPLFDVSISFGAPDIPQFDEFNPSSQTRDTHETYETNDIRDTHRSALAIKGDGEAKKTAKFDLSLYCNQLDGRLSCNFRYAVKLFKPRTIGNLARYFTNILNQAVENPQMPLSQLQLIPEEEKEKILHAFNLPTTAAGVDLTAYKSLYEIFQAQSLKTPAVNALIYETRCLTYRRLEKDAACLASKLRQKGVRPGHIVALELERSPEMITAILAVLKAGAAYLPILPHYPAPRKQYMLEDSGARLLLTRKALYADLSPAVVPLPVEPLCIDDPAIYEPLQASDYGDETPVSDFTRLPAYIIYTSGTTGTPRGVVIEHRNVINLVQGLSRVVFEASAPLRVSLLSPYVFDASVKQIFPSLLLGHTLVLVPEDTRLDGEKLIDYYRKHDVKVSDGTPQHLNLLFNFPEKLRRFFPVRRFVIGGEALEVAVAEKLFALPDNPDIDVVNVYGPTECSDVTTFYPLTRSNWSDFYPIPIGKPIAGAAVYILDAHNQVQGIGIPGELCISGSGVGRGYLNDPVSTAAKFIPNPFDPQPGAPALYRSGDLARWLDNGNIQFLGRIDQQVKIRGFRIEPGEIESHLLKSPRVRETTVIARPDGDGEIALCAYVVPEGELSVDELRIETARALPDYMVPSYFVTLDKIPLTANGKINKKALPEPDFSQSAFPYTAPRSQTEDRLAGIWADVLGVETGVVGIETNFFHMGGHSLKATRLVSEIHKQFNKKITLADVFRYPTIAQMAPLLYKRPVSTFEAIPPQPEQSYYPLSYSQKRLWFLYKKEPANPAFNMTGLITLPEAVDPEIVKNALAALIGRHEGLRTCFKEVDDEPVQEIRAPEQITVPLEVIDHTHLGAEEAAAALKQQVGRESAHIFDLRTPSLFRATLIKSPRAQTHFLFNLHHIISDGWSQAVLKEEFGRFYHALKQGQAYEPAPLPIQYKDYAAWQNRLLTDEEKIGPAARFWKAQLGHHLPILTLPLDFPHDPAAPGEHEKESAAFRSVIPGALTERILQLAEEQQGSVFMVLLSGFFMLLSQFSGQKDIILAIPAAARQHEALKKVMGMFVNTLILKNSVEPGDTFLDFFRKLQEDTFNVLEYQDFPLELICGRLKIKYPDISVFFNMINTGDSEQLELANLESVHSESVQNTKFPMVFYLKQYKNGIELQCHYYKKYFKPATIETLMKLYEKILDNITSQPGKRIGEFSLSGKKKKTLRRKLK